MNLGIKIEGDGSFRRTAVLDAETGEPINRVRSLKLDIGHDRTTRAILEVVHPLPLVNLVIEGDLVTERHEFVVEVSGAAKRELALSLMAEARAIMRTDESGRDARLADLIMAVGRALSS